MFTKGYTPWNKKYYPEKLKRLCGCGCGQWTSGKIDHGKIPLYLKGHFVKGKKIPYKPRPSMKGKRAWNKGVKGRQPWMNIEGLKIGWGWDKKRNVRKAENHPNWKGGKPRCRRCQESLSFYKPKIGICMECLKANSNGRDSTKYKNWRKAVFERDYYTCQLCGKKGTELHADHIKPWAFYPDLRFDVTNGRTVCVRCHPKTETYGPKAFLFYKLSQQNADTLFELP